MYNCHVLTCIGQETIKYLILSYTIIPSLRNGTPLMRHSAVKTYKVYGTSNCRIAKQLFRGLLKQRQNEQSTCPWYVYLDYDSERLPQIIAKAGGTCKNCIGVMDSLSHYVNVSVLFYKKNNSVFTLIIISSP